MKKLTLSSKFFLPILGLMLLLTFSLCNAPEKPKVADPEVEIVSLPMTTTPNETGRPDFSQFDFKTNAGFHEASWAYFRWLTDTVDVATGKLRFETLYNADRIGKDMKKDKGLFLTQSIKDTRGKMLGGIRQADSDGILVDKNGHAVYSSMHIDEVYHDFIQEHKLYDPAGLRAIAPTLDFPEGAFSLKVAWKVVENEDMSKFYVTEADVAKLAYNSKKKIVLTDETERKKVAMVGFHIALVVPGHPEMVWITFEHSENAPNLGTVAGISEPISNQNFTFYKAGATMTECNLHPPLTLDVATQKLSPVTNVFRRYEHGNAVSNPNPKINANVKKNNFHIDSLNQVNHADMGGTSIWQNYEELGAIWFNQANALKPNQSYVSTNTLLTGSLLLSNSVIETFTQNEAGRNQCFGCHNTEAVLTGNTETLLEGKNVLTSHILVKNYLKEVAVK